MKKTNAYFQLLINDNGTYFRVYPKDNGGEDLNIDEVISYFEKVNIHEYNLKDINNLIHYSNDTNHVQILNDKMLPVDEMMSITTSDNKLLTTVRFYAPSNIGSRLSKEDIIRQLNNAKVKFGIDENVIQHHILYPTYCTDVVIAKGLEPKHGKDAIITYHFQTDLTIKPQMNEDGTVDFHQLNNISHIKAGSVLATLTPEDRGTPGKDVYGNDISPKKVIKKILRFGKDITISEDGLNIISNIDGHAILVVDKVYVYNTYEVSGDVDTSTGDIEYEGNIHIKGNVRGGFKVIASGNIEINGVVEAAEIRAGGNIILKRGIQGMGKGLLVCGGDLFAKFIESSTAMVDGFVHTETILHSRISAEGDVLVQGNKGSLMGGHIRSATLIEAKTIGSSMGTTTIVEVGINPKLKDKVNENTKLIQTKTMELNKIKQIAELLAMKNKLGQLDKEKKELLIKVILNIKQLNAEITKINEETNELNESIRINKNARIKVIGDIYPGVKIIICDDFILVHNTACHCQYKKHDGEISSSPL